MMNRASPSQLFKDAQERIEGSKTDAFLEVFEDAGERAQVVEKDTAQEESPLWGQPIALKDNILFAGHKASAASRILEDYTAAYSATVVKKLLDAGAVFVGRTNMDEFAMGSSTENSSIKTTKNPNDLSRVPGGSSGGSAAAVAEGLVAFALGTDTGGSVRQPAAFCGVVGFKPSYGAVSRSGVIAMGSSLDQVGPIARNTEDARALFEAIRGKDSLDSTSVEIDEKASEVKTIGVPRVLVEREGIDSDVLANFNNSLERLKEAGYEIKDVDIEGIESSLAVYYIVMPAEVSSNLARYDGVRYGYRAEAENLAEMYKQTRGEGFGEEVRRRIMLGTYVLSSGYYDAYYRRAAEVRTAIRNAFARAFAEVDVIATPTTPTPAFKIGEKTSDPLAMYLADIFTVPASIAGLPAISIPSGTVDRDGSKLPLGIQFIAPYKKDLSLFTLGAEFESISK